LFSRFEKMMKCLKGETIMKSCGLTLLSLIFLFGCAMDQATLKKAEEQYRASIPKCSSENECREMWTAAQTWVTKNTHFKIYSITDSLIRTYDPPTGCGSLGYKITKESLGSGKNRFIIESICRSFFGCSNPYPVDAALDFNNYLSRYSKTQ
jgi:hypothetical protein